MSGIPSIVAITFETTGSLVALGAPQARAPRPRTQPQRLSTKQTVRVARAGRSPR
jgi:hypothetical protein